jgi:hypothetical protein
MPIPLSQKFNGRPAIPLLLKFDTPVKLAVILRESRSHKIQSVLDRMTNSPFPLPAGLPTTESDLISALQSELKLLSSYRDRLSSLAVSRLPRLPFTFSRISDDSAHLPKVSIELKAIARLDCIDYEIFGDSHFLAAASPTCVHVFPLPIRRQLYSLPLPPHRRLSILAHRCHDLGFFALCDDGSIHPADHQLRAWAAPLSVPTAGPITSIQSTPDHILARAGAHEFVLIDQRTLRPLHRNSFEPAIVDSAICARIAAAAFLLANGDVRLCLFKDSFQVIPLACVPSAIQITASPGAQRIIVRSRDRTVVIEKQREMSKELPPASDAQDCGAFVAVVCDRIGIPSVYFYDGAFEPIGALTIHAAPVRDVRIAPAGQGEVCVVARTVDGVLSSWVLAADARGPAEEAIPIAIVHAPKQKAARPRGRAMVRQVPPVAQPYPAWPFMIPQIQSPKRGRRQTHAAFPRQEQFRLPIAMPMQQTRPPDDDDKGKGHE